MWDINKRIKLNRVTVADVIKTLSQFPEDSEVYFNGMSVGFIHVEDDNSSITFDDSDCDEYYV